MSNFAIASSCADRQPLPAFPQRYMPGTLVIGKYRLEALLGEGGMGAVWLARNITLDAQVALKLIHPSIQAEATVERLRVEARVQAKLKHPNIVHVFDFGQTELGDAFIVMEVLEGVTLRALMEQCGRLNAAHAVRILLPVIGALCHAHENGVVHRDLKPDNIFLVQRGVNVGPKVLDFGIAKLTHEDPNRRVTQSGTLLGTPSYMAPEQARGLDDVDHRADIWAICVVLYEVVSGTRAFPGEGYAVLRSVVEESLPGLVDTGGGESALSPVLARGLERDPALRFQSMRELGTALAQWLYDQGESEDFYGSRISWSWNVAAVASTQSPEVAHLAGGVAAVTGRTRRLALVSRLALVAGIVLAAVSTPSQVRVEAKSIDRVVDRVAFATNLDLDLAPPVEVTDLPAAPILRMPSLAPPQAEGVAEPNLRQPARLGKRLSEAALGLKVAY